MNMDIDTNINMSMNSIINKEANITSNTTITQRELIKKQINELFDNNQLEDLKKFISRRKNLNMYNIYMLYVFHFVQSLGILSTTYGASSNNSVYIWSGITLNMFASLIQIYEKINHTQIKKLEKDIQLIHDDKYLDETALVDPDTDMERGNAISQKQTVKTTTL